MIDILLSMPVFYFYLVFVVALLITALWQRETGPPVGDPRATARATGQGFGNAPLVARCIVDRASLWSSGSQPEGERLSFEDLHATLLASYAARFEQALRMIRGDLPLAR